MTAHPTSQLTERELAILDFERRRWKLPVAKEQAITAVFGISGPKYYHILNDLIDRREAMAHDPLLVKRLRKLRDSRRAERCPERAVSDVR